MLNKIVKPKFYFPEVKKKSINKQEFVDLIVEKMREDGGIRFAGYLKEEDLKKDLLVHYENIEINYGEFSKKDSQVISKIINEAAERCHVSLPHPNPPIFSFVYPWFPSKESQKSFKGVTAFAEYYTMHLFLDFNNYTKKSLEQTFAHEWNHLVFYRFHSETPYTLLSHIVMEGCAEVFREEVMKGAPAPWSLALTENELSKELARIEKYLPIKGMEIYKEVFFGSDKFKKWTGYSIGYRLIKEFRSKHPDLSWEEIIKYDPKKIFINIKKKAKQ